MSRFHPTLAALAALVALHGADARAADRSAPPQPKPAQPFTIQQPQELKLKNGLRVLLIERKRAPLVDVVASVQAGISSDPQELPGLAGWTADMLTEGAGDLSAIAFSDAVQSLGAQVSADAHAEHASVSLHTSSARFKEAMKLFALALTQPRFDEGDWRRVQQQTFGYFMYQAQDPGELSGLAGGRENWGPDHRFGWNLEGTPKALVATGVDELKAFHAARYRPDTTTLVVVGDVTRAAALQVLEETLGAWSAQGPTPPAPKLAGPVQLASTRLVTVNVPNAPQTVLRAQTPVPAELLPYTADVEVMNTLLGGSFSSRLNQNLREEHGYSYGAGSRFGLFSFGNVFLVRTSVATPVTTPAAREVLAELARIKKEPPTDEEAARARNLAALSLPSVFDSGRATASFWADVSARGIDPKRVQRFLVEAVKVDARAIHAAAQRAFDNGHWTLVAVGDTAKFTGELARVEGVQATSALDVDDLLPGLQEAMAALQSGSE